MEQLHGRQGGASAAARSGPRFVSLSFNYGTCVSMMGHWCHLGWRTLLKCNKTNHACLGHWYWDSHNYAVDPSVTREYPSTTDTEIPTIIDPVVLGRAVSLIPTIIDPVVLGYSPVALGSIVVGISVSLGCLAMKDCWHCAIFGVWYNSKAGG